MSTTRRQEVSAQIRRGWVTKSTAALALRFDLDTSRVDELVSRGVLATRKPADTREIRWADVLAQSHYDTAQQFLSEYWPVRRQKERSSRLAKLVTTDATSKEQFEEQMARLHRYRFALIRHHIKEPGVHREAILLTQLVELARVYKRFDLAVTSDYLEAITGLGKDRDLPRARDGLIRRGVLKVKRDGTTGWLYFLQNPKTRALVAQHAGIALNPSASNPAFDHVR